ncbi:hypothetical protein NP493_469g01043 [Ridgeia piscesae]|uniref:Plasminogen receptor (KT) n=1 Tax=Ridgeia piscesae TaxID=27915 RepID=A0AAD9KYW4_RIDPI|nr:hypothetical protein NP493_469g01043 [Ridgeia piscesae]
MGSIMGKAMDDSMQKNQETMKMNQRIMMERQMQMQNVMREKMMAMQLGKARELFNWWAAFYVVATCAMIAGFKRSGKPTAFVPLIPFTFVVGYQADLAHGNKMERIRAKADKILENEMSLLRMPGGDLPTIDMLDELRQQSNSRQN